MVKVGRFPSRGDEAKHRHQREKEDEDARCDDVDMVEHDWRLPIRSAAKIANAETGTSNN